MPNCQTHISALYTVLQRPRIQHEAGWLAAPPYLPALLLGSITPDARVIARISRESTHFYDIPMAPDAPPAHIRMLETHPDLCKIDRGQHPLHAAFVAGYVAHLVMDVVWLERIVMDGLFIDGVPWGIHHPNWLRYSLLMTRMEYDADRHLPRSYFSQVREPEPDGWLPFMPDRFIRKWRQVVAERVEGGGARLVSTHFSRTNHMSTGELEMMVLDDERMDRVVHGQIPRRQMDDFYKETYRRTEEAVLDYLAVLAVNA